MSAWALVCVREHSGAKGIERLVLFELAGFAHDDGGGAWPKAETIADRTGVNRRTVQHALYGAPRRVKRGQERRGLIPAGLVTVKPNAGKNGTNLYQVALCPLCVPRPHEGNGRPLRADKGRTTRVPGPHQGAYQGRTNTVREVHQEVGAASPAPSRGRSGSAANTNPGRVQVNDPNWRDLGPPTGIPESVKAEVDAALAVIRRPRLEKAAKNGDGR
jgi:hypothetical protein